MLFLTYLCVVAFAVLMTLNAKHLWLSKDTSLTNSVMTVSNGLFAAFAWFVAVFAPLGWFFGH